MRISPLTSPQYSAVGGMLPSAGQCALDGIRPAPKVHRPLVQRRASGLSRRYKSNDPSAVGEERLRVPAFLCPDLRFHRHASNLTLEHGNVKGPEQRDRRYKQCDFEGVRQVVATQLTSE